MSAATSRHCHKFVEQRRRTNVENWLFNREARLTARVHRHSDDLTILKQQHADAKPRSKARGALNRAMKAKAAQLKRTASRQRWCARKLALIEEAEKTLVQPGPLMARRMTHDQVTRSVDQAVFNFLRDTGLFGKARGEAKQARG